MTVFVIVNIGPNFMVSQLKRKKRISVFLVCVLNKISVDGDGDGDGVVVLNAKKTLFFRNIDLNTCLN